MKIYIKNIPLSQLKLDLIKKADNLLVDNQKYYDLLSKESGRYHLYDKTVVSFETSFVTNYELVTGYKIEKKSKRIYDFICDKTIYTSVITLSQLPVNYLLTKIHKQEYKTSKNSSLKLVIEYIEETHNFESIMLPIDFYFIYNKEEIDFNDMFVKEEINMFLLLLN